SRADEDHEIGLGAGAAVGFEQIAEHRNVAEEGDLLERAAVVIVEKAADADDLAVVDGDRRLDLARVEALVGRRRRDGPRARTHFLPELELDRAAGVDLR